MTTDPTSGATPAAALPDYVPVRRPRRWLPLAAIVIASGLLITFLLLPTVHSGRSHPPELRCAKNLRAIGQAVQMYANENKGAFPGDFAALMLTQDVTSEVFVCPKTNDTRAEGPTTQAVAANLTAGGHLSYVYAGKEMRFTAPATAVLAYEPLTNHGNFMFVLFADGHTERLDATRGQKLLDELAAGHNPPRAEALR